MFYKKKTWQVDLCKFQARLVYIFPGQPGLHRQTMKNFKTGGGGGGKGGERKEEERKERES